MPGLQGPNYKNTWVTQFLSKIPAYLHCTYWADIYELIYELKYMNLLVVRWNWSSRRNDRIVRICVRWASCCILTMANRANCIMWESIWLYRFPYWMTLTLGRKVFPIALDREINNISPLIIHFFNNIPYINK